MQTENPGPRPYYQLPGEPDKWYEHFRRFCALLQLDQVEERQMIEANKIQVHEPGTRSL